jgi:Sec-independent protein secretion pathway component TatC
MTPTTVIIAAFLLALVVAAVVFPGAVIVAIPLAVLVIAAVGFVDFNRRRKSARSMEELREGAKAEKVDFTEWDKDTLSSSD